MAVVVDTVQWCDTSTGITVPAHIQVILLASKSVMINTIQELSLRCYTRFETYGGIVFCMLTTLFNRGHLVSNNRVE